MNNHYIYLRRLCSLQHDRHAHRADPHVALYLKSVCKRCIFGCVCVSEGACVSECVWGVGRCLLNEAPGLRKSKVNVLAV